MRNLPIDSLRAFITIADMESVSAAAEILGRSQPAVSLQLKKLEEDLGKPLFLRGNRGLALSEIGKQVLAKAREIITLNDEIVGEFHSNPIAGKIKLGIPSEFATTLVPKILGKFTASHPNVSLEVFSDLSKNLTQRGNPSGYDLVLSLHDNPANRNKVTSDELVWVCSESYQLSYQTDTILPLVLAHEGCKYRKRALSALRKIQRESRIVHTNADLFGIQAALNENLGITVLAKTTVPRTLKIVSEAERRALNLPQLGSIDIALQQLTPNAKTDATQKLVEYIRLGLN